VHIPAEEEELMFIRLMSTNSYDEPAHEENGDEVFSE
jgi:hypothetical protein